MFILGVLAAGGIGALVYHHLVQRDLQKQVAEHKQQLMAMQRQSPTDVTIPPPDSPVQ